MKTQIKKRGDSNVLVLNKDFMKYHDAKTGDWVDLSDVVIQKRRYEDETA